LGLSLDFVLIWGWKARLAFFAAVFLRPAGIVFGVKGGGMASDLGEERAGASSAAAPFGIGGISGGHQP
jgi:hypothetical protein